VDNANLVAALWIGLALVASLVSIRLGISVALIEIGLGVLGGNVLGLQSTPLIDFLAAFGAILLTFLAGAEIDPASLRRHLRPSLVIGGVSFAAPAIAAFLVAYVGLGWSLQAAQIAGLALSTTSVAVVYAVMIESGLAGRELGKLILAACFVTDLGAVLFLGILFADFDPLLLGFAVVTVLAIVLVPRVSRQP
jgi:Kef-type K+ transport system membrane component KefB